MSASLVRPTTARAALRAGASATRPRMAGLAGTSFVRNKATLPDLSCTCRQYLNSPRIRLRVNFQCHVSDNPLTHKAFIIASEALISTLAALCFYPIIQLIVVPSYLPTDSKTNDMNLDDYGALEPSISGKIMELHHKGHHNTYVTNFNNSIEKLQEAQAKNDIAAQIALKPAINFNGGGHLNHSLFWENLAPKSSGGGEPPSGQLAKAINDAYGNFGEFQTQFNTALAGIQGSGWTWLVKDKVTGGVGIKTYAVSTGCPRFQPPNTSGLPLLLSPALIIRLG